MIWTDLLPLLFGEHHQVSREGELLRGTAQLDGRTLAVVGTTDHAAIGIELALAQARLGVEQAELNRSQRILDIYRFYALPLSEVNR